MPIVPEDVPSGEGAFASMQFGDATRMQQLQKEVQSRSGTSTPQPQPQQSQQPDQGGQPPQGPAGQAVQPPPPPPGKPWNDTGVPRGPDGRLDMNHVFSDLTTVNAWRQNVATWASHPAAGPYLKLLGKLSTSDRVHR